MPDSGASAKGRWGLVRGGRKPVGGQAGPHRQVKPVSEVSGQERTWGRGTMGVTWKCGCPLEKVAG